VTDGGGDGDGDDVGDGDGDRIHGFMIHHEFRATIGPFVDADTGKNKYNTRRRSPFHSINTL
jgi:hypothetical protein